MGRLFSPFSGIVSVGLMIFPAGYAQRGPDAAPKKAPSPATTLTLPALQRRFCAAFEDDLSRQRQFDEEVAAATNPIGAALAEKNEPKEKK